MDKTKLELKRLSLNEKLEETNLILTDPEVIKLSHEIDLMIVEEMKNAMRNTMTIVS